MMITSLAIGLSTIYWITNQCNDHLNAKFDAKCQPLWPSVPSIARKPKRKGRKQWIKWYIPYPWSAGRSSPSEVPMLLGTCRPLDVVWRVSMIRMIRAVFMASVLKSMCTGIDDSLSCLGDPLEGHHTEDRYKRREFYWHYDISGETNQNNFNPVERSEL